MDYNQLEIKDLIDKVIVLSMKVHSRLKNGFVEEVYKKSLSIELNKLKIPHSVEQQLNVYYDGQLVGAYRADIVICNKLILELKAVNYLTKEHSVQLVNYLHATGIDNGLLINFGNFDGLKWFHKTRDYPIIR